MATKLGNKAIDCNVIVMTDHQTVSRSRQSLAAASASSITLNGTSSLEHLNDNSGSGTTAKCRVCLDKVFSGKFLKRHMPIFQWLPVYKDSFMGNIIYTIFGSCKDNILGSTAIASLLTFQVTHGNWQKSILFTLLTGLIELLMGLTRLGFIIDFVSGPVSAGFTSAVALIIFTSQMKNILVVKANGASFLQAWISIIKDIHNFRPSDTLLGVGSIVVLVALRYIGNIKVKPKDSGELSRLQQIANKFFWFLGVSRNALLVFVTAAIVGYYEHKGFSYVQLTGFIPSGFPPVEFPSVSITRNITDDGGMVVEAEETFWNLLQEFGTGLLVIPLISLLETIAVCRTFANGKPVDTNQELISLGLANITNSFFRGYRINGGLARASVNTASGGRTQFVNVYISVIVTLALLFLAEYFYYIPKATLAAIIIAAVLFQLQYQTIVPMWQSKKSDLFIGLLAFVACLIGPLSLGVFLAITINILYILYQSARPEISVDLVKTSSGKQFLKLTPDRCLIFPSMEFVRNKVVKSGLKYTLPVVFDCTYIYATDFTTTKVIEMIVQDFNSRNQKLIFFNLRPRLIKDFEALQSKFVLCYSMDCIDKLLADTTMTASANGVVRTAEDEVTKL